MKILIAKDRCVGHARCNIVAGELFPLDDSGYIAITELNVPEGQEALARRAVRACPERILKIVDEEGEAQ